jgi:hypothetical protein
MAVPPEPQPGIPFKKDNGMWTFYIYPGGIKQEAAEYPDEESASQTSLKVLRIWEVNGGKLGPIAAIL